MWIMGVVMMTAMFFGLFDHDSWHRRGHGNREPVHTTIQMDHGHWQDREGRQQMINDGYQPVDEEKKDKLEPLSGE